MKITKFGHCCLLLEENGVRILIDPGKYSTGQNEVKELDALVITHEHADHCHVESIKAIVANNLGVLVVSNSAVQSLLGKEGIPVSIIENGQSLTIKGMVVEGFGNTHGRLHASIPPPHNVGYLIAERFYYGGDSFTKPNKPVDILALPVIGLWMKLQEALAFAEEISPKIAFPMHDAILKHAGSAITAPTKVLGASGIQFMELELGEEYDL